ncbi:hypothetical protein [Pseudoalteromonas sp. SCSIO_11900]|uniref:hypothetical protein n=1 Tax=Pseudoalteromonas sp. SCSIO_11900 TaxID=1461766 RepID=UPI00167FC1C7|nr:hypothetical protein [Pseudoalteromonas sp. SCSIO_11900]
MTSTDKNIIRAKQVVDSWPTWKKNIQLTKYKSASKENSQASQKQPQLRYG